jgi:hypothetical protein
MKQIIDSTQPPCKYHDIVYKPRKNNSAIDVKAQKTPNNQSKHKENNKLSGITLTDFKTFIRAITTKIKHSAGRKTDRDLWNKTEL